MRESYWELTSRIGCPSHRALTCGPSSPAGPGGGDEPVAGAGDAGTCHAARHDQAIYPHRDRGEARRPGDMLGPGMDVNASREVSTMAKRPAKPKGEHRDGRPGPGGRSADSPSRPRPKPGILLPPDTWSGPWASFVEEHHAWWGRCGGHGPVYALTNKLIDVLVRDVPSADSGHRSSKSLISDEDAEAKHEFIQVCRNFSVVVIGVCGGRTVDYPLLTEWHIFQNLDRLIGEMKWEINYSCEEMRKFVDPIDH